MLDRATELGGDGAPPGLPPGEPLGGKPFMLLPLEPLDIGGEASWPRLFGPGEYVESFWYFEIPLHSLPPTETGDKGPLRPFIVDAVEICGWHL